MLGTQIPDVSGVHRDLRPPAVTRCGVLLSADGGPGERPGVRVDVELEIESEASVVDDDGDLRCQS